TQYAAASRLHHGRLGILDRPLSRTMTAGGCGEFAHDKLQRIQFSNSQTVIARSEATKQSILPRKERMDCFASLAMTISRHAYKSRGTKRPSCAFISRPKKTEGVGNAGSPPKRASRTMWPVTHPSRRALSRAPPAMTAKPLCRVVGA